MALAAPYRWDFGRCGICGFLDFLAFDTTAGFPSPILALATEVAAGFEAHADGLVPPPSPGRTSSSEQIKFVLNGYLLSILK